MKRPLILWLFAAALSLHASDTIVTVDNLMWQDDQDKKRFALDWQKANAYCQALRLGGYDDWRLPTKAELYKAMNDFDPFKKKPFKHYTIGHVWSSQKGKAEETHVAIAPLGPGVYEPDDFLPKITMCVRNK